MSKQYNIRWGRSDYAKLSHLVRKTNKKIFEIEVRRPDINAYQPDYLEYSEIKSRIKTRRDFNNVVKMYERYLREGAEEITKTSRGANITKWANREYYIRQNASNTKIRAEKKRLGNEEVTIAGKGTGNKRSEMGDVREKRESKRKTENMSQEDFKRAFRQMEREMFDSYDEEKRKDQMRRYVKGLIAEGYSDDLIEILKHVDSKDFERIFYIDEVATIDFIYDPAELKVKDERMRELWQKYANENVNNVFDIDVIKKEVAYEYEHGERIKGQGRIRRTRRRKRR